MIEEPVTLTFLNRDAVKQITTLTIARQDCERIARWYGAYCAGDDYDVLINGEKQTKDIDGTLSTDPAYRP